MDNETTRLIFDEPAKKAQDATAQQTQPKATQSKPAKKGNVAAAAAGGFVAGAAVGVGATAFASNSSDELPSPEEANAESNREAEAPSPEQAILANDEGVRYAHVEADNFGDAFAQARAQVGPGGVFEYEGRLYGTYTADEWNGMSAEDRADYQARVNEVAPAHHASSHAPSHDAHEVAAAEHLEASTEAIPANAEMISAEPVDNEIRVLGVQAVQNEDGQIMNIALVESNGDQALLVDVDNDGRIEALIYDDNGDGQIQESEMHDISPAGLEIADLEQAQAAQEGNMLYASNDDMPDYTNDADMYMEV